LYGRYFFSDCCLPRGKKFSSSTKKKDRKGNLFGVREYYLPLHKPLTIYNLYPQLELTDPLPKICARPAAHTQSRPRDTRQISDPSEARIGPGATPEFIVRHKESRCSFQLFEEN
jgi:hypothetical protein